MGSRAWANFHELSYWLRPKKAAIELAKFEPNDFCLGFIGAHDGRNAAFIFVDFWGNENELFHRDLP